MLFDLYQVEYSDLNIENESLEYGACNFKLNELNIKFRVAKITPTKNGQFVTFWKRNSEGSISSYDVSDGIDFFIIAAKKNSDFGLFIFPQSALYEQGVLSKNSEGGKRAMRVYPPWDIVASKQAKNTQEWQLKYFYQVQNV